MKNFLSIVFSALGGALVLAGLGSIASDLFDWNLALSIGGSDIALPKDLYAGIAFIIVGAIISALHFFWEEISQFVKKYKAAVIIVIIVLAAGIFFGGSQFIMYMDGGPAVSAALYNDHEKLVELFANGEVKAEDHEAMMMWVAQKGHVESLQVLLDNGVSPNATREDGLTALEAACNWGGEETVKILQAAGAEGECVEKPY